MGLASFDELKELVNPRARAHDDLLNVIFYQRDTLDAYESEKSGRPIYKKADFVKIIIPGDRNNIVDQPVFADEQNANSHVHRFRKRWEDYKAGKSQEQSGTPLMALTYLAPPILASEQVLELKHFGVHTAEQLAGMDDQLASRFLGGQQMKQRAAAYLDMARKNEPQAALVSELRLLRERVAQLEAEKDSPAQEAPQHQRRK